MRLGSVPSAPGVASASSGSQACLEREEGEEAGCPQRRNQGASALRIGAGRTKPPGSPDRCVKWQYRPPSRSAILMAESLRVRLIDASNGNIDPLSDISPISY